MNSLKAARRIACSAAAASALVCTALTPAAQAATALNVDLATCAGQSLSQPFAPFLDFASYFSVPGGSFESGAGAWTLTGGASAEAGNEPWHVAAPNDGSSLSLPAGSSATTPAVCVGIDSPSVRLFAHKTDGDLLDTSTLLVESITQDANGVISRLPMGTLPGSAAWSPTSPLPLLASLVSLLPGDQAPAELRFTPVGPASWQIDDVYVDPYHRCC